MKEVLCYYYNYQLIKNDISHSNSCSCFDLSDEMNV